MVVDACKAGNEQVIADVKRICQYEQGDPFNDPKDLCGQLFHTVYMGMSKQSSKETRSRAKELASEIGGKSEQPCFCFPLVPACQPLVYSIKLLAALVASLEFGHIFQVRKD